MLKDLLDERLIQLHVHADGWEDAIRKAAAPLVETGKVKESYVDDIVKGVHEYGPYIVPRAVPWNAQSASPRSTRRSNSATRTMIRSAICSV